jgi:hypothetical protein
MNYTVNYPDKNKQKGHAIVVLTKGVYVAWSSADFPNVKIALDKYIFFESFLENYIKYMWERKFVPDWNYLYKNLNSEELGIFEKMYLEKQKKEGFKRDWERPDLTKQQIKWVGDLGVKDWKSHLAYHTKYGNNIS